MGHSLAPDVEVRSLQTLKTFNKQLTDCFYMQTFYRLVQDTQHKDTDRHSN